MSIPIVSNVKGFVKDKVNKTLKLGQIQSDLMAPKYFFHNPIDYNKETHVPMFGDNHWIKGQELPIPPPDFRPGYSPDNDQFYIEWGKSDHDVITAIIEKHYPIIENVSILDFGCSSGRVLRHFLTEHKEKKWKLYGTDIQAHLVEWMRRNFPDHMQIMCGTTYPHLPFKDNSLDVIYGISVFTHTKYLWDMWLNEFKRVLKPGGLIIQTVQCETAWRFYHQNRNVEWVKNGHPQSMLDKPEMDEDFFLYGDGSVSQTFFKEEVIKKYWGRYLEVLELLPPPSLSYQNWLVARSSK
jgi:SAM-dependent methyltransferase